jgi:hypothetical protein
MAAPESFVGLSQTLTGLGANELPSAVQLLDAAGQTLKLSDAYYARLHSAYPGLIDELITAWEVVRYDADPVASLTALLTANTAEGRRLRLGARQVIKIWYLSTIDDPTKPLGDKSARTGQLGGDLGQFQLGAIWRLIGAPPQGYSNFPHGYWAAKP